MKRGADKQLTKDDSDEDVGEDGPGTGFKKADETVLATRKIRALPRRSAATTPSGSSTPEPSVAPAAAPAPKFAGFGGFGGFGTGSATSFTFAAAKPASAPAPEPSPPATATTVPSTAPVSFFGSSTTPSAATTPTSAFTSAPAVSSTASNATKTFASFISNSAEPKPVNGTHKPQETPEEEKFKAEKQYYLALRGLNVAFVDAITKAVDEDPFLDLAETYERYKNLRAGVKADYEKKSKPTSIADSKPGSSTNGSSTSGGSVSFAAAPTSSFTAVVKAPLAMPAPPATFSGFGPPAASTSTTSSSGGGFKFDASKSTDSGSSTKSVFSFPPPASGTSGSSSLSKPADSTSSTSSSFSGSAFGSSSTPSVFGSNLFGSNTGGSKLFGDSSSSKTGTKDGFHADDNPFVSPFGSSKSGDKASSSTSLFSAATSTESATKSTPLFGGSVSASSSTENADKPPPPSGSLFGLGTSSSGFAFGGGSGAFGGKPVGFGFGNVSKSDEAKPAASSSSSTSSAFSWPAPSAAPVAPVAEAGDAAAADEDAPPMKLSGPSIHDADGEGEEDEETNHQIRAKVFKLTKKDDGSQTWTDLGIGLLKVKAHKENDTRRLLLRNSSTGKVIINFNVYKAMDPSVAKNVVSFMGHDDGNSVPYKIRVKTPAVADELKAALDREIEFVKAKSSD